MQQVPTFRIRMDASGSGRYGFDMASALQINLGRRLRVMRERARMTQEHLAVAAGLSQAHISRLESGKGWASIASLSERLEAAGLDPGHLWHLPPDDPMDQEILSALRGASPEVKKSILILLGAHR